MGRGREIGQNSADVWRVGFYLRAGILGMGTCETRSFIRIYLRGGEGVRRKLPHRAHWSLYTNNERTVLRSASQ